MRVLTFACAAALGFAPAVRAADPPAHDPRAGERLFVGEVRLQNGGAPCLACHAIAGHGLAWSASFGPDLSDARASYDTGALEALLADVQLPSMEPVYRGHALLPEERAHVAAFLLEPRTVPAESSPPARLALEAGAAALALLGLFALVSRRRMPDVKNALRARARAQGGS
jgi:mono/diheme cytochrome c family protein